MDTAEPAVTTSTARLHDGSTLPVAVVGQGPPVLLPVRTSVPPAAEAAVQEQWGGDPFLGRDIRDGLADRFTVVTADYEGHRLAHPAVGSLTPEHLAADLLAVADAVGVERFAYYGYSWLALAGLQLALRTDRLTGLVMGGFPPLEGPYAAMLAVTRAAHAAAVAGPGPDADGEAEPGDWDQAGLQVGPAQTGQFVTLYEHLQQFDEREAAALAVPRLCFAGAEDTIDYGPRWGGVQVVIGEALQRRRTELEQDGWEVVLLPGLDHLAAMRGRTVLTVLRPTLERWLLDQPV